MRPSADVDMPPLGRQRVYPVFGRPVFTRFLDGSELGFSQPSGGLRTTDVREEPAGNLPPP